MEESSDGKLSLLPIANAANTCRLLKTTVDSKSKLTFDAVSHGYFALLQVFQYLNTKDRMNASKVCKLWHQISKNSCLWTNIALKNCRVRDWTALRDQLNANGAQKIDLKKMLFAQAEDSTWSQMAKEFMLALTTVQSIELPKIKCQSLHEIVKAANASPITKLTTLNASSIDFAKDNEGLDLEIFAQMKNLQELKLKPASGGLIINDFTTRLNHFVQAKHDKLTRLALLSLDNLSEEDLQSMTTTLVKLTSLELGNCDGIQPRILFEILSQNANLKYLRLERGTFDENIGQLSQMSMLSTLELIDFEMVRGFGQGMIKLQNVRKFLLIPSYKDEVIFFKL